MMDKKTRVLLLGTAFSANLHLDVYARNLNRVTVVGIAGKDRSRIESLASTYGITDFVEYEDYAAAIAEQECDLVDICLPSFLHHDAALRALRHGCDVICEKPLAISVPQAEEIVRTASETGQHIYYAEDWLFAPALSRAREIIEEGAIGKPVYIRARECHSGSHSPFAQRIEHCGGGSMIHLGIHAVGFVLALNRSEWTEVTAVTSGGGEQNIVHTQMEGEDLAVAIVRFQDGVMALLEGNYVTQGGMEDSVDIYGTEGCLHVDLTFSSAVNAYSQCGLRYTVEKAGVTTGWSRPAVDEQYSLGYVGEIEEFLSCHRADIDARPGTTGRDGLEAMRVIHAIYESAATGTKYVNHGDA